MRGNSDNMSNSVCATSSSSFKKGLAHLNIIEQKKKKITLSSAQHKHELKPQQLYLSFLFNNKNHDADKLPQQYENLRHSYDIQSNNQMKDITINNNKNQNIFYSPRQKNKAYRNTELDEKINKYSKTDERSNHEVENKSKVSEEIKKLREDRQKRFEAKEKQSDQHLIGSSYNKASNTGFWHKQSQLKSSQITKELEWFKKKKKTEEIVGVVKKQKKNGEELKESTETGIKKMFDADKYKVKEQKMPSWKQPGKDEKLDKDENKYSTSTKILSNQSGINYKTITSEKSNKKLFSAKFVEVNNFILGKSLGEGKFGVVYQAFHKPTGWLYAIKKVPKNLIKSHLMIDQFILQVKLQTYLYHENILSLYTHFDYQDSIYLVLQYMDDGTLFAKLKKNKILPETQVSAKIKQIVSAVKYLHDNEIAHRDIKPENIVLSHGVCKLCDFGWATICSERRKTYCGTFDYAPPEILEGVEYDYTVDLWCIGVLTYELLVGKAPFYHISRKETMKKILNVEKTTLEYPKSISITAINFIDSLIKKDPKQRLSSQVLLKHPFLKLADKNLSIKH